MQETTKREAIINLLHLARKAGKVKSGMSACCSSCIKNNAELVICAEDISNNSKNKIKRITLSKEVKLIVYGDKQMFSNLFQRTVTGIICVEDKNFSSGILRVLA